MNGVFMTLDGKVAIITGGSRGIGVSIVRRFHQAGARVALCARSMEQLKQHEEVLGRDRALAVRMDIRDAASVAEGIRQIIQRFGKVHVLVNNAGISGVTPIDADDSASWLDI